jgi:hypothetical protein
VLHDGLHELRLASYAPPDKRGAGAAHTVVESKRITQSGGLQAQFGSHQAQNDLQMRTKTEHGLRCDWRRCGQERKTKEMAIA